MAAGTEMTTAYLHIYLWEYVLHGHAVNSMMTILIRLWSV